MGQSIFQSMGMPQTPQTPQMPQGAGQYMNPYQMMAQVMSAMRDPAGYLKGRYPDIPNEIMYDPNRVFEYLQQAHGFTQEGANQVNNQIRGMTR